MVQSILAEIDAEIARLQEVKALLTSTNMQTAVRKPRGLATKSAASAPARRTKRRKLSAEARECMRQAQIKRWAAAKKSAQPNLNATVSPIPGSKKKAAKATR